MAKFKNQHLKLKDNQRIYFGDDDDSSVYFDGTDLRVGTTLRGVTPTQSYHLATKDYFDSNVYELAQDAVGSNMTGEGSVTVTYNDLAGTITISGAGASVAGSSHSELSDLDYSSAGHTGFASALYVNNVFDTLQDYMDDNFVSNTTMTTISGDIVAQIISTSGVILSYVSTNYIDNSEMTTISGDIVAQIVSSSGVLVNYVDESIATLSGSIILDHGNLTGLSDDDHPQYVLHTEFTTYSGDIVSYVSSNYVDNSEMTTISGDLVDYVDSSIVALSGSIILDHGGLTGLADDDHTQYILVNGTRAFSSTVSGVYPTVNAHLATKEYVDDTLSIAYNEGVESLASGVSSATIALIATMSGTDYTITYGLRNTTDANPGQYMLTTTNVTTSGFTVLLSDNTDSANYSVMWRATNNTSPGVSQTQLDDNYYTKTEITTISGDIISQIPDVSDFITDAEVATISGDIIAQIPTDYISDSEMTTISGDIIAQIITSVVEDTTPQLGGNLDLNGKCLNYGVILTSSGTYVGEILTVIIDDGDSVFGSVLCQGADFHYDRADADSSSTAPVYCMALETSSGTKTVLIKGQVCDTSWNWSAGKLYLSETIGTMTQTKPADTGDQIQVLGFALSADTIWFDPVTMVAEVA